MNELVDRILSEIEASSELRSHALILRYAFEKLSEELRVLRQGKIFNSNNNP